LALALMLPSCGNDEKSPSSSSGSLGVSCTATPSSGTIPLTVQFSATVTGAEDNPTLSWSFGDGTAASVATASRTYAVPGTYNAAVEVRSGGRNASCNATVTALSPQRAAQAPNRPPEASFNIKPNPPTGNRPLTVEFNACLSSDPDGDKLQFGFDVFDGMFWTGHCRREHTYRTAGTFKARVCVSDDFPGHADICRSYTVTVK
jgi:PKD repeat protein